ncbi:signal peptidase II [Paenibacillus psychroresistens]|uniref:Lipoprotein signal peptidase n=1 Tax=Paenibacillus psychroresistens TaxID=1778678 RepID=A0A6B8RMN7_9BACL|nr:signal peptidase II [Paenibacillus psychroresistens]QGQ97299.1 signal peptidase II [Paenibacillus psychroresistens]
MIFYSIAILVVLVDQICKILVRMNIKLDDNLVLWGIQMTHIENSGMAGGLFQGYAYLFGIVAIVFVGAIIYFRKNGELKGIMNEISFAFLVGGAMGNGIDRLLFGQVTDFLISRSGNGVLNMADHAIEIGVLLLIGNFVFQLLKRWSYKFCTPV